LERLNRMTRSLPAMATAVVLIMAAALAAGAVLTVRTSGALSALRTKAAQADTITDVGEDLLIELLDAESNTRGYLLSGRAVYLVPYTTAVVSAGASLAELDAMAHRLPSLTPDVTAIQQLTTTRLALLADAVKASDIGPNDTVRSILTSDDGLTTMTHVRSLIERVVQHAAQERDRRAAQQRDRERLIFISGMLGATAGVLLLGTASLALLAGRNRLLRAQQALQTQAAQWQGTVENLQDGVAVFDGDGSLLQWNHSLLPLTAFPRELAQQGTPFSRFAEAASDWVPPVLAAGAPAMGETAVEVRAGSRVLEVWRNVMPDGGQMLTIGDVTRRVQAEEIARQAQKMEVLGQLTGGVAHDFNNLLQVVSANLELVSIRLDEEQAPPANWLRTRVIAAMEGVQRGARLTRHLLAFARRQPLAPAPVAVGRLLAGLDDMLRRTLGPNVAVEVIAAPGLWDLRADTQQLENAILNLAINARDAMVDVPSTARLTIEARNASLGDSYSAANAEVTPGQYVVIAVTDTGCGMTAEQMTRAVEPFYTTKPEGQGTGLGLSMVYGFAKQSGGHLKLYSEVGYGTTARLYIPRTQSAPLQQDDMPGPPPAGRGETVLLVEDDAAVRVSAGLALSGLGYRVEEAPDADAAMRMLELGLRPDLLFTDVMMPGALSARSLAEQAKALHPGLAVVFTSGYTENSIVHNGQLDPQVHLVSKPWRIEELAHKVRLALDQASEQAAPSQIEPDQPPASRPPGRLRILLVEDDTLVRMVTADRLADMGHEVVEAADAEEALRQLPGVDLLITDVGLGQTDGLTLAEAARARIPGLPVIVASGRPAPESGAAGLVWLTKPYDNAALKAALQRTLVAPQPSPAR
jgi:signal transduction histidine kinase/DNA-binding response OmpR family regulator